jgi:hypothetical protein
MILFWTYYTVPVNLIPCHGALAFLPRENDVLAIKHFVRTISIEMLKFRCKLGRSIFFNALPYLHRCCEENRNMKLMVTFLPH